MRKAKASLAAALVLSALTLFGCNNTTDHTASVSSAATSAAASKGATTNGRELTAAQVNVSLSMQGSPLVSVDGKNILATVNVSNNGTTALSSTGKPPVNLAAHGVNVSGKVVQQDLARAQFAHPVPVGGVETVQISLPASALMGESAEIMPVQEGVAWFDTFGTKPVVIGPFKNCDGPDAGKICDESGRPLPVFAQ